MGGDADATTLARAAKFRVELEQRQVAQCERLAQRLPLPQIRLPYLFTAGIGPAEIDTLADAFAVGVAALDAVADVDPEAR